MNYFEFYNIPISFTIYATELKKIFFQFSKKYHPDFFINASDSDMAEALELSTLNTNAFKTLSNFDLRMKYVLQLKNSIEVDEKYTLPNDFLMEMMELNEAIDELQFETNSSKKEKIITDIKLFESQLQQSVQQLIVAEKINDFTTSDFEKIKSYYFKKKYLKRLEEQINKGE